MSWVIFLAVFFTDGSIHYETLPMESLAMCQAMKAEFEDAYQPSVLSPSVHHYRVGCIQE